jgi:hypothetical protein
MPSLSPLQKQILALALENKQREGRSFNADTGADVYYSEILTKVFRFPAKRPARRWPCNRIFDPTTIGRSRYRSAVASVSRAVLRLHIRGAVQSTHSRYSTWAGASLTPAGVEIAHALANSGLS